MQTIPYSVNSYMLLSIVTLSKNSHEDLLKTVNSVVTAFKDKHHVEYLIYDGSDSADNLILDLIPQCRLPIRYYHSCDSGIYDAINKSSQLTKGEWILYVHSGDYFISPSGDIDQLLFYLDNEKNYSIICANGYVEYPNNGVPFAIQYLSRPNLLRTKMSVLHEAVFVHRNLSAIDQYDTSIRIAADYDFLLRNITCINPNPLPFFVIYHILDGVSSTKPFALILDNFRVRLKYSLIIATKYFMFALLRYYVLVARGLLLRILVPSPYLEVLRAKILSS